jgi:hemerythrin
MQWKEEYSVGIVEIDDQHKGILEYFTLIENAIESRESWSDVFFKLEQLRSHAHFHFSVEESLMRLHGYPKLADHAELHKHFITKLDQLQMTTLSRQVTIDTIVYLRKWYADHMKGADKDYAQFIIRGAAVITTNDQAG